MTLDVRPLLLVVMWCSAWQQAVACRCTFLDPLNKAAVDATAYIAHVRIKAILPPDPKTEFSFRVAIEELAHFKGERLNVLSVSGGHPQFDSYTSCDFGIEAGQEWIIFATASKGGPLMQPCWYNRLYRNTNGMRDWQYQRGFTELEWLRKYYNKLPSELPDGFDTLYYPNSQAERITYRRNGKIEGTEFIFYHTGQPYGRSEYRKNRLHGTQQWFSATGSIVASGRYRNGKRVGTFRFYDAQKPGNPVSLLHHYTRTGRNTWSRHYYTSPHYYLAQKSTYRRGGRYRYVYYHPNGRVSSKGQSRKMLPVGTTLSFDENGKAIKRWRYGSGGKLRSFDQL